MTFRDFQILKNIMCDTLKAFDGPVSEKKRLDDVYLKLVDFTNEIKFYCDKNGVLPGEVADMEVSLSYNLEDIINKKLEKQNLLLDF